MHAERNQPKQPQAIEGNTTNNRNKLFVIAPWHLKHSMVILATCALIWKITAASRTSPSNSSRHQKPTWAWQWLSRLERFVLSFLHFSALAVGVIQPVIFQWEIAMFGQSRWEKAFQTGSYMGDPHISMKQIRVQDTGTSSSADPMVISNPHKKNHFYHFALRCAGMFWIWRLTHHGVSQKKMPLGDSRLKMLAFVQSHRCGINVVLSGKQQRSHPFARHSRDLKEFYVWKYKTKMIWTERKQLFHCWRVVTGVPTRSGASRQELLTMVRQNPEPDVSFSHLWGNTGKVWQVSGTQEFLTSIGGVQNCFLCIVAGNIPEPTNCQLGDAQALSSYWGEEKLESRHPSL